MTHLRIRSGSRGHQKLILYCCSVQVNDMAAALLCFQLYCSVHPSGLMGTLLNAFSPLLPGEIKLLTLWTLTHERVISVSIHNTWWCFKSVSADRWAAVICDHPGKAATALMRIMGVLQSLFTFGRCKKKNTVKLCECVAVYIINPTGVFCGWVGLTVFLLVATTRPKGTSNI